MKKTFAIMIVVILIFTLCSCKKNNNNATTDISSSESSFTTSSDTSSEPLESTASETVSDNKSDVDQTPTSNSTSSIPKEESKPNPKPNQNNNTTPVEKYAHFTSDTSRAPGTDIGSTISDGYIYYINPHSGFPDGLFRKKISEGEEETLTERHVEGQKVLNGTVYFMSYDDHQKNLYKCDTDGSNMEKIFDNITRFEVAGNWIFAIRNIYDTVQHYQISRRTDELYAISTDGSVVKRIRPQESNNAGSEVTIYGFSRGYLYVLVNHLYFINGDPYTLTYSSKELRLRIDYRSKDLVQQEFKSMDNANYTYNGKKQYDYWFEENSIINDHIIQEGGDERWVVSFLNNTATTVYKRVGSYTSSYKLKDYYVNVTHDCYQKKYKIVFINYDSGEKREFNVDWSEYVDPDSRMFRDSNIQDVTSNSLLLELHTSKGTAQTNKYYLYMMDLNGQITKIYEKLEPDRRQPT